MDTVKGKVIRMDTMGKRLKFERERLGMSQALFAVGVGSSKPSQVRYENGERYPDGAYLERAAAIGADVLFILTGKKQRPADESSPSVHAENGNKPFKVLNQFPEAPPQPQRLIEIHLHDVQASAGPGQLARDGDILLGLGFPEQWLSRHGISPSKATLIYVEGDSMSPAIENGSMVLIDHNRTTLRRRRIYAFRDGDELYVKRLEKSGEHIIVLSDNPEHDTRLISGSDLDQLVILGEVVWSGRDWV